MLHGICQISTDKNLPFPVHTKPFFFFFYIGGVESSASRRLPVQDDSVGLSQTKTPPPLLTTNISLPYHIDGRRLQYLVNGSGFCGY